jgi:DNA-binding GntR family transcriptional regulator
MLESPTELLSTSHRTGFRTVSGSGTQEEHATILADIRSRDLSAAERAMKNHLLHARSNLGLQIDDDL